MTWFRAGNIGLFLVFVAPCLAQELPLPPFQLPKTAADYQAERERLVADGANRRFDAQLKLSSEEQQLDAHLQTLRRQVVDEFRKSGRSLPAEPFDKIKVDIQQTKLYRWLRTMPKGGVLHIHSMSTAPVDWILDHGIHEPNCYVCWPNDSGDALRGELQFYSPGKAPQGYQLVSDVLAREPDFPTQLRDLLTIGRDDDQRENAELWTEFNRIFQRVGGLAAYQPLFQRYYAAAFRTLLEDNVTYVELRAGMGELYDLNGKAWPLSEQVSLYRKIRDELRQEFPDFDLKLILSGHRWADDRTVWDQLQEAVALRQTWSQENFVLGFDLVGDEDAGHRTEFFLPDWVRLREDLRRQQATLPFYFHDGESNRPGDDNLFDAFLLGSRRVGHGLNLFRFPTLQEAFKQRGIAVEVCPISNQQLRYVSDLRLHPAAGYLNSGIPCVLGNDDPGILGNDGLAFDFWEAVVAWKLDLRAVKQLSLNSLRYSGMTDAEKAKVIAKWNEEWNQWVQASLAAVPRQ